MASRPTSPPAPGLGGAVPRFSWPASLAVLVLLGLTGWSAYGVGFDLVELLSGGQQQRVAVARLLVQEPGLILADEPFAAVDPVTAERVMEALLELNRGGATLLVNLHDVAAARTFPRVVALREGRVTFDGAPKDLTQRLLESVYEGDERRMEPEEKSSRKREPIRVAEGRDGVSAH